MQYGGGTGALARPAESRERTSQNAECDGSIIWPRRTQLRPRRKETLDLRQLL